MSNPPSGAKEEGRASPQREVRSRAALVVESSSAGNHEQDVPLFDAHCHLVGHPSFSGLAVGALELLQRAASVGVKAVAACACSADDWNALEALANGRTDTGEANSSRWHHTQSHAQVYPQFGLHPWWSLSQPRGWLEDLEAILLYEQSLGLASRRSSALEDSRRRSSLQRYVADLLT
eukprot:GHVT01049877.1.p1 GENE.GHVT01049877.1~~GHVT01049877.1.p1  ORF type:complete len:178 (+),score=28.99 GHVT01049877.1:152-685(+)